jgi:GAF domain-containing protein
MRGYHEQGVIHIAADDLPMPREHGITYIIRTSGQPIAIADAGADPRVGPAARAAGFRSILGVPLRLGERVLGVLYANSSVPRAFAPHEINLLQIFANQAAVALENARLFADQDRRLQEVSMLQRVGMDLNANLDLDALLNEVVRAAVPLLGVQASGILLVEGGEFGNTETRYRAMRGYWEDGTLVAVPDYQRPRPGGLADTIRQSATPLVVADTETDPRVGPVTRGWGIRALMGVPLRVGSRVLGVLYANSTVPRQFAPHEVNLLQIFANQITVAIENARLFEERGRRLKDIATLQQLGVSLTATLDLEAVLAEIARATLRLLSVASSRVLLIGEGQDQESHAVHGSWQDNKAVAVADTRPSRPSGLTQLVRISATPVVIPDTAVDARVPPPVRAEGVRALIGVPLRLGERVLGVLYAHADAPRAFAAHEIDLLQIFANQAAVAIENARLFEERRAVETRLAGENMRMARELVTARATQQRLLPSMPRTAGRLRCHGVCLPAMEVGGDYFDVLPLPDGRVALALGDVTGKGTAAVMITSMIKTALLSQVALDPAPAAIFNALYLLAREFLHDRLMTFFYGLWDPAAETLFYFNAGHLFPYVRRANGQIDTLEQSGLPLGAVMGVEQDLGWMPLHAGDSFICFSDGIVEAEDATGQMFGFNRLEAFLRTTPSNTPEALVTDLVDEVWHFAGGPPDDDVTVLVAQILAAEADAPPPPPAPPLTPPPAQVD